MGTRIKPVIPLEIGKRNRKTWKTSPSQCVAILGESDEIKEKAFQLVKEIIEEKGFIAIWFYDPFDHSLYLEPFKACRSVELREDFAQSAQPRVQAFASEESWREHELGE